MRRLYSEDEKADLLSKVIDLLEENKNTSNNEVKKEEAKMADEKKEGKALAVHVTGKDGKKGKALSAEPTRDTNLLGSGEGNKDIIIVILAVLVLFLAFWAIKKCPETKKKAVTVAKVAAPVKVVAPVKKVAAPVKVVAPEMLTITIVNNLNNPVRVIKVDQYGRDQVLIEKLIPKTPAYIDVPVAGRGDFMSLKAESHCWLEGISEKSRSRFYQFRDANRNLLPIQPPVWVIGG